jgi:hypothetical protein
MYPAAIQGVMYQHVALWRGIRGSPNAPFSYFFLNTARQPVW